MSRFRGGSRGGDDGLAYGEIPQRWDRDRFQRFGGGGGGRGYEEDYRYQERDTPGRRDIAVADRIERNGPRGSYEERDRYFEEDRYTPRGGRRRTDRELFGDVDPRELSNMAVTPYRKKSVTYEEVDERERRPPRPGLMRRQSSLDTFDRRPVPRYEREVYRVPVYEPQPYYDDYRGREYYEPEDYREVEIRRERSVHRGAPPPPPAKSVKSAKSSRKSRVSSSSSSSSSSSETVEEIKVKKKKSTAGTSRKSSRTARSASVHESFHESVHAPGLDVNIDFDESVGGGGTSVSESIQDTVRKFKKGKTRMPKRLVRREAIMDLGYPFEEEDAFFVLTIALEKEQIDEIMRISETYKSGEKTYKVDKNIVEEDTGLAREEVYRTEWINPPTVAGSVRAKSRRSSPAPTARSRRTSRPQEDFYEERRTVIESPPPPPPVVPVAPAAPTYYEERKTVIEEPRQSNVGSAALVVQQREYRSDREIKDEIARLEAERRAVRLEREADRRRDMALRIRERPVDDYQMVEYDRRPQREVLDLYERDEFREESPERKVIRVEKDRKGRMALVRSKD